MTPAEKNAPRYFDEASVRSVLEWDSLVDAMEAALQDFSSGNVLQPVRTILTLEEGQRYLGVMPAVAQGAMGLKLVSFYPANAGSGVATHHAMIVLMRPDTGEPLAAMDGTLITEMRTAAVSAAATRRLASHDARVLALIGSGVQAGAHLAALRRVRNFDEVRVWSPTAEHARRFAAAHGAIATGDARAAVNGADVIVTATNAQEPVLRGSWVKPGAHVNAIGAARPNWRELDDALMASAALVVDSREAALKESGDVIMSRAAIYAEAGEVFSGAKALPAAGRTTVFKSLGLAVEDVAAAKLVHDRLARAGQR
jgi:ornithine cyclodeaminase/alanine dehydrogenase-like protein (mu-crystallin family)